MKSAANSRCCARRVKRIKGIDPSRHVDGVQLTQPLRQRVPVRLLVEEIKHVELPGHGAELFGAMPGEEHHRMLQVEAAEMLQVLSVVLRIDLE